MKKFLSIIIFAVIIFFCGQNNFANAQDVYACNTGGLDFYVDTNTIVPTGPYDKERKRIYFAFYVNVKKVEQDTGRLRDINQWNFYQGKGRSPDGGELNWVFDYYLSGKGIHISKNQIARNILLICQRYGRNSDWCIAS